MPQGPINYLAQWQVGLVLALMFATDFLLVPKNTALTLELNMKFSLSNLLAIASILVWASAWAATEKKADAEMPASTVSISQAAPSAALAR